MTNEIRNSLARLQQIKPADLNAVQAELPVLTEALRKEVEAQTGLLGGADPTHAAYTAAATDLVSLLELTNTVVAARAEFGKLAANAGKVMQRLLKKAPK